MTFSHENLKNLKAELHSLIDRNFRDSNACYRSALWDACLGLFIAFDSYQVIFNDPARQPPEDPLRDPADPDDQPYCPDRELIGLRVHHPSSPAA